MADYPTMPLRTDALIGDTMHLSATEFGGYVRLLVAMWRNGSTLPDDDTRLMRFAGMTPREWRRSRDVLMAFFTRTENGDWTQKRLRKEWLAVTAKCEQAARAINTRWLKTKETDDTGVSSPKYARNTTHDPVSKEEKKDTPLPPKRGVDKSDADALEILSGVMPRDVAEAYAAHRRAKRAKLTKRAAELIAKALFGHPNPASVVEASIANGWTGVFPDRWRPPRDGPEERPRFDVAAVLRELKEAERKAS